MPIQITNAKEMPRPRPIASPNKNDASLDLLPTISSI